MCINKTVVQYLVVKCQSYTTGRPYIPRKMELFFVPDRTKRFYFTFILIIKNSNGGVPEQKFVDRCATYHILIVHTSGENTVTLKHLYLFFIMLKVTWGPKLSTITIIMFSYLQGVLARTMAGGYVIFCIKYLIIIFLLWNDV